MPTKGRHYAIQFKVVDQNVPSILGLETCTKLNLVQRVDAIEKRTQNIFSEYNDVFNGLGCITNVVYHIEIDKQSNPVIHPPRRIPVTLRPKVKEELSRMEKLDVIQKAHESTEWVNSMVTIIKPNGKLRIYIDPRDLNQAVKRDYYPMRTVDEVVTRMPNAKVFSVLDHESAKLCTFNTPYGRYMFKRLPFGLSSSQDIFQRIMSEMFEDIEGVEVVVDDLLVWGEDEEQHDSRLLKVLERARARNLKLNKDKCHIKQHEISYVGHILTKDGLKPDPKKTEAITEMPSPQNKEELQRFLGMLTYLTKFIPNLSQVASPLRVLLEKNVKWHWDSDQEHSFKALKQLAIKAPVLKYFDPHKPTKLSVDASSKGLGAVLQQDDHPVAYASRALTQTQQNYTQIEKEMLAVVFGCTRFHEYIYGLPNVEVETDHKPLEAILKKPLHQAPARLQRMIITVQKYPINVTYRPGKELVIPDTLSRAYLQNTLDEPLYKELEINLLHRIPISDKKLQQIKAEIQSDQELHQLRETVQTGWPNNKADVPTVCRSYWNFRDEISLCNDVLLKGEKLIIPKSMRPEMLRLIHASHMGIEKCKRRAKDIIYWPGMSSQIEDIVSSCSICNTYSRNNTKEPMMPHNVPDRPWAQVGADLFQLNGHHYLLLVDYYSGFIEVSILTSTTSKQVITHCKSHFSRHGIPDLLITDNGPQFSSDEFKQFSSDYNMEHRTSSPLYPQSNGMAEKAVQTVKALIKKAIHDKRDPYIALLDYRNTPVSDNLGSPSQRLMGRRTRTLIPTVDKLLRPKTISPTLVHKELQKRKDKQKYYYDKHTKPLSKLKEGEDTLIQLRGRWYPAKITKISQNEPRSYIVTTPQGRTYRRNRRHLRRTPKRSITYQSLTGELNDDEPYDEIYDDPDDQPREDRNTNNDNSPTGSQQAVPSNDSSPTSSQQAVLTAPLRRSQRTIRKPEKYADSYY